ncbi:MAG: 2TM domain-containing protein [Actinomycetota bacterium]
MTAQHEPTTEELAEARAEYLVGLLWHVGAFVILNVFLWWLDLAVGPSGVQWAFWVTAFWGFALAWHALAWLIDGRQVQQRMARRYLEGDLPPEP